MRVLVLSKYSRKGASSRYRMYQYFPYLIASGDELTSAPLFDDEYLDRLYSKRNRFTSLLRAYVNRFRVLLMAKNFDILWVEKELFPWVPWFIESLFFKSMKTAYVVDYDDAIFHQYDTHPSQIVRILLGKKCDQVMKNAKAVVAGNSYLAARATAAGAKKVVEIPTVVSDQVFAPKNAKNELPVIGWIGSMSTAIYLEKIRSTLAELQKKHSFKIQIVGAEVHWPELQVECLPWSEAQEVALIQNFDIGVMPLLDSPWERGKCGFKLIQYMACGKPVVADPVGVNAQIVEDTHTGYLARPERTWHQALENLLLEFNTREEMGKAGRQRFEKYYSLECWQGPTAEILRGVY